MEATTQCKPRQRNPNRNPGKRQPTLLIALLPILFSLGCLSGAGVGPRADAPLPLVPEVDLDRFAGLWYVLESMPTSAEEGAHDATEHYAIEEDGEIAITFHFRKGAFDGPEKTLRMRGWPIDDTGAEWRVQPVWPVRLAYLVLELGPDYGYTVIGHPSKRYVWIMAREKALPEATLAAIRARLAAVGYDVSQIRQVPQSPADAEARPQSASE